MTVPRTRQARVRGGDGLVARFPGVLLVAPHVRPDQDQRLEELLALCSAAAEAGSHARLARQVAGLLLAVDPEELPAFGLLVDLPDDVIAVLVVGAVDVVVGSGATSERLSGQDSPTWVDRLVRGATVLEVATSGAPAGDYPPRSDLVLGVVSGSALQLTAAATTPGVPTAAAGPRTQVQEQWVDRRSERGSTPATLSAAAPVTPPDEDRVLAEEDRVPAEKDRVPAEKDSVPAEEDRVLAEEDLSFGGPRGLPAHAAPVQIVQLTELTPDEARSPLPDVPAGGTPPSAAPASVVKVRGILCPLRHLNDPRGLFCNVCGRNLVHVTHTAVEGPRPSLGVLVLDDATVYSLDADYLIGREPEFDDGVVSGRLRPLRLEDDQDVTSRVHAEVRLSAWDVLVEDRGSANGTYVAPPDSDHWQPLAPRKPQALQPGSRVRVGRRVLQFESRHYR